MITVLLKWICVLDATKIMVLFKCIGVGDIDAN